MPNIMHSCPLLFLSHSGADTEAARSLKRRIEETSIARERGLKVWFDKDDLRGGEHWQPQLEETIQRHATAFAVYVGARGVINWVDAEVRLGLSRAISGGAQRFPFIPILASGAKADLLPGFAQQFQGVRDVETNPDEFQKLIAAVLGDVEVGVRELEKEPFFGLKAIDESRSYLFFGRERETQELIERLSQTHLLMVTGDSGSGKSSLVRAGLIPQWRGGAITELKGRRTDEEIWHVIETRPGINPLRALGDAVFAAAKRLGESAEHCGTYKNWVMNGKVEDIRDGLRCGLEADRTRTLVVIDQFEELLTLAPKEHRQPYVDLLLNLADPKDDAFALVLTMRRDYYNLCSEFSSLYTRLEAKARQARYLLGRMHDDDLHRVVTEPLKLAGVEKDASQALAQTVLLDVGERPGDLALVQFALTATWQHRSQYGGDLLRSYSALGRVEGALAQAADKVYADPDILGGDANEREIEAIFIRLVRLGDTGGATRRVARRREFNEARWGMLQALATERGNRLVQISGSEADERAEIFHEALVTQWPRFQRWLQAAAGDKRTLDRLIERAETWVAAEAISTRPRDPKSSGRDQYLATGAELQLFADLVKQHRDWLSPSETEYVDASTAARQREETRRNWLFRAVAAASILFATATVIALLFYYSAERETQIAQNETLKADEQARAARWSAERARESLAIALDRESRFLADRANQHVRDGDAGTAMLLALAALPDISDGIERPPAPEAEAALFGAYLELRELVVLKGHEKLLSATLSPEGRRTLVMASEDDSARLWDVANGDHLAILEGQKDVRVAAISPDAGRMITASTDPTALLWNVETRAPVRSLPHDGIVRSAAFSPDSRFVVTGSDDTKVRLWDAGTGELVHTFTEHADRVRAAVFSQNGRFVLSASDDATARLWETATGKSIQLKGHTKPVRGVAFSPDGQHAVTTSLDGTARVWDVQTGDEIAVLSGHGEPVRNASFSPDGRRVVTASDDTRAGIWDADSGKLLRFLQGHLGPVYSAEFSPDGRRVVTASDDTRAGIWDAGSGKLLTFLRGHLGPVYSAEFSPDPAGANILTASSDGTARLWSAGTDTGKSPAVLDILRGEMGRVRSAALSPNGRLVLITSDDNKVVVWDAHTGMQYNLPHSAEVRSVAFSPDGQRIVTESGDNTTRIWSALTGEHLGSERHDRPTWSATFMADRVEPMSVPTTLVLWNAESGVLTARFEGFLGPVYSAEFSPDGKHILTAGADNTARIWDVQTRKMMAVLKGHSGSVFHAEFSPDGQRVVTASDDKTARIWDVQTGETTATLDGHAGPVWSAGFSPDGQRVVTVSDDGTMRIWRVFPTTQALVDFSKKLVPRCLKPEQRAAAFLGPDAPDWCRSKWPFNAGPDRVR
jgi:WD40 repeat protein